MESHTSYIIHIFFSLQGFISEKETIALYKFQTFYSLNISGCCTFGPHTKKVLVWKHGPGETVECQTNQPNLHFEIVQKKSHQVQKWS